MLHAALPGSGRYDAVPRAARHGLAALLALLVLLAWPAAGLHAQPLQPVPALSGRVIDQTGTLTAAQAAALDGKLAAFEAQHGPQMVIVIVRTTLPEDIADFTQRLGDAWQLGRRDVGDGLLLVVAKDDRKVRIAPAKSLEGAVPDLAARQIIEQRIRPAFRADDYAGGLNAAVDALIARVQGEGLPAPQPGARSGAEPGLQWEELLIFFFAAVPIIGAVLTGVMGRKLGAVATAAAAGGIGWWISASALLAGAAAVLALVLVGLFGIGASAGRRASSGVRRGGRAGVPPIIWGGGGGGGGWGGGGGGGFSSGGGGDFGGGGASGDW
ncbi:TPM domain-containing protein [Aquincola sp. MAHUQ-54]|uniref:TPM domain-containing protein n=1 Tax=Aquincola agrisoli TaxID=3119538 RepID=A0AAW9Q5J0_9BURK